MEQTELFEERKTESGARFSECRKYRFALWRIWDESKPLVQFIGLNPSTANESEPDPTIRSVIRISKHNGYGGFYMTNCFPLVSSKPEALNDFADNWEHDDADLENLRWLLDLRRKCQDVVFAWGGFKAAKILGRDTDLIKTFSGAKIIGLNNDGSPKHPLFQKGDSVLVDYPYVKVNNAVNSET